MMKLSMLLEKVTNGYETFEFHQVYHAIHNFCVVDMSNFYLDVLKDRLYVEKADGESRRAAQTTIYKVLDTMERMIAPILAFTSEEIWKEMPHTLNDDKRSVLFNEIPKSVGLKEDEEFVAMWDKIHQIRDDVSKALEAARTSKIIGKSLEAKITLACNDELYNFCKSVEAELATAFIVSEVEIIKGNSGDLKGELEGLFVTVSKASGEKCERCWIYSDTVGTISAHPTLCSRCAKVLAE